MYISTYQYILVHTCTYMCTTTHLCVLLFMLYNVCLILVGAMAWYKGVHHQLYYSMKCHAIVHTDIYQAVQVCRILREMTVY